MSNNNHTMTTKEIFELRKQGRIEEAYDAIRPMLGYHNTRDIEQMLQQVADVQPTTDAEQQEFYLKMTEKYHEKH